MQNPVESSHDRPGRTGPLNGLPSDAALLADAHCVRPVGMVGRQSPNGAGPAHLWQEKLQLAADRPAADRYVSERLAMVSHELRNCLGAIRIATSLIKLNQRQPDAAESARQVIERRAAQMSRLIDDLLEVGRRGATLGAAHRR